MCVSKERRSLFALLHKLPQLLLNLEMSRVSRDKEWMHSL